MSNYNDIINLPHHKSTKHPSMSMQDRAAQFSPFAALTGYADAIKESSRHTDAKIELGEDEKARLNRQLQLMQNAIGTDAVFNFKYFSPDKTKSGGAYLSYAGSVKKIDSLEGFIYLNDSTVIEINQLVQIESDYFKKYELDF